jgi:hypothetical protein
MVKKIFEDLTLVADGIDSVTTIVDAVRTGTGYLKVTHPEVQSAVRALVVELGKSVDVVAQGSACLTNFQFAVTADTRGSELARFNDYFITSKREAHFLREHIHTLRSHCGIIRDHALSIGAASNSNGFIALFATMLSMRDPARERALSEKLDSLAFQDDAVANAAERMMKCLEESLALIQNSLGKGGAMYVENIPAAVDLLAQLGPAFKTIELQAAQTVMDVRDTANSLN